MNLSHAPLRLAIGAFVLNSGISKLTLEGQAAEGLHGMAAGAVPPLRRLDAPTFARLLAGTEIAIGSALLLPVVPSALVGAGLLGLGGGLMRVYWATPGLRRQGSVRPTEPGTAIAKDSWLVGAGLTLILDDLLHRGRRLKRRRHR
ncbi:hypothetical protein ACI2K4_35690 [Micromonospora sp. NPDC050397]|uniref:hypothetical protein n=1 Tax=Micromonospora sp. NPDC050397 TaxID=3364279 RepID=UPI00384E29CA